MIRAIFVYCGLGVFYFTITRMDALGFGALLALLATSGRVSSFLPALRWAAIFLPCLLVPGFVFLSGSATDWLQVIKLSLIPATYCAVMGCMVLDPRFARVSACFSTRPLRWVGKISYGLYVYHPFAFELTKETLGGKTGRCFGSPDLVPSFCSLQQAIASSKRRSCD